MSQSKSGIRFLIDATEGDSRRLHVGIEIQGPFTESRLIAHFPRWVPGSYFLREPIQHMTDFLATDQDGNTEAFKHQSLPIYGMLWHPERMPGAIVLDEVKKLLD